MSGSDKLRMSGSDKLRMSGFEKYMLSLPVRCLSAVPDTAQVDTQTGISEVIMISAIE